MKLSVTDRTLPRYHLVGTLLVVLALALALGASFLWTSYAEHRDALFRLEKNFENKKQERLRAEMASAIAYLDFVHSRSEAVLRHALEEKVSMAMDQHMGDLYPFTLADKLRVITEPCHWYTEAGGVDSPWGRPVIPMEMISVLLGSTMDQAQFRGHGPAVGLFAGQEIRRIAIRLAQQCIQPAQVIAWSLWRRAHQAAAQRSYLKQKTQL